ncbi:hypothetical protein [Olsenella massiliensis]|uniref:hypothetical protein n=1 Tax=Olsenella massiliensis TaxID=1622075 RepID=UPI00071DCC35|nr:hypothetical protein [Olsenella massiliensis]
MAHKKDKVELDAKDVPMERDSKGDVADPDETPGTDEAPGAAGKAKRAKRSAMVSRTHEDGEPDELRETSAAPEGTRRGLATPAWIAICVAALLLGAGVCYATLRLVPAASGASALSGKTTVSESELDAPLGSYTYNGVTHAVTVRDVITASSTLDAAKGDDGSYKVPAADGVLSVARNNILMDLCAAKGINVSDDEVSAYAQQFTGTSDFSQLASTYHLDEATVKAQITAATKISKLRDAVVSATVPAKPTAPSAPSDGNKDAETPDYATYILNLAGDEWDADAGAWKDSSSPYATALANYKVTSDSASYAAAQAAYYVAFQQYQTAQNQYTSEWTTYVNAELSKANLVLSTLVA